MEKSEQIDQLAAALANAQGKIRGASKDSSNPFYRSKYADLESCWDAIRDAFTENGLAVAQPVSLTDGAVTVTTILLHTSGQWMSERMTMTPMRQGKGGEWVKAEDPQSLGSCITYNRRYSLQAMTGLTPIDDDGNAASGIPAETHKTPKPPPQPQQGLQKPPQQQDSKEDKAAKAISAQASCGKLDALWAKVEADFKEDKEALGRLAEKAQAKRHELLMAFIPTADAEKLKMVGVEYIKKFSWTTEQRAEQDAAMANRDLELAGEQ